MNNQQKTHMQKLLRLILFLPLGLAASYGLWQLFGKVSASDPLGWLKLIIPIFPAVLVLAGIRRELSAILKERFPSLQSPLEKRLQSIASEELGHEDHKAKPSEHETPAANDTKKKNA
jgi:hypothetical protein